MSSNPSTKLRIVGLMFGFLAVIWGVPQSVALMNSTDVSVPISLSVPQASIELDDLDVRDQFNRKISSEERISELRSLFVSGLNTMLLFNLTPSAISQRDLMSRIWNLLSGFWRNTHERAQQILVAFLPERKTNMARFSSSGLIRITATGPTGLVNPMSFIDHSQISSILSSTILLR